MSEEELNEISYGIIGAAMAVHSTLGPGLLESACQACPEYEMAQRGIKFEKEMALPVVYGGVRLECGYRLDLYVEDVIIVELKSVAKVLPIHEAQLLSYLRLADSRLGLLINFNVRQLKNGLTRVVNAL